MIGRLLHRLAIVLPVLAAVVLMPHEAAAVVCPGGRTMHIVAHQDDDIVFFGTDVIADLNAGRCVTTVCLTAGDAGGVARYWLSRERGAVEAHARILGVDAATTDASITIGAHGLALKTLTAKPRVSMVFMRLPDGNIPGGGFPSNGDTSLQKLWYLEIPSLPTVTDANADGLANLTSYDTADLTDTLRRLITRFAPDSIRRL